MNAVRHLHPVIASADLFPRVKLVVNNELRAERLARETADVRAADAAVLAVDVDGFFAEQEVAMQRDGHWVRVVKFNENGNHMAGIEFIPTAGEQPQSVFGPHDYRNTCLMQIWATRDGRIRLCVSTRQSPQAGQSVALDAFGHEQLEAWFTEFVRFAMRFAAEQHAGRH